MRCNPSNNRGMMSMSMWTSRENFIYARSNASEVYTYHSPGWSMTPWSVCTSSLRLWEVVGRVYVGGWRRRLECEIANLNSVWARLVLTRAQSWPWASSVRFRFSAAFDCLRWKTSITSEQSQGNMILDRKSGAFASAELSSKYPESRCAFNYRILPSSVWRQPRPNTGIMGVAGWLHPVRSYDQHSKYTNYLRLLFSPLSHTWFYY